jgi:hypothetical protein
VQTYQGLERISNSAWSGPLDSPLGHRSLIDVVGTYHVTPAVTVQANYDSGKQFNAPILDATGAVTNPFGVATWNGIAGYVNWQMNSRWASSLRVEGFNDDGGYRTGFTQRWNEETVTLGYSPSAQLTFRAEGRWDTSNHPLFTTNLGGTANMSSVGLQALIKY